jgi:hypothetical protein
MRYRKGMTLANRSLSIGLFVFAALAMAVLAPPDVTQAQTGFEAGARLGYGIAMGKADADDNLSDTVSGQVPIWLDVGYRPIEALMVGLFFQYGFGILGSELDDCDIADASCSASDIRLGVQGHFHLRPREQLDPWLGLGIGYEWLTLSQEARGTEISGTASGFEFLNLQVGLDIRVLEHFVVGPFLSFSLGQFSSSSAECSGNCGLISSGSVSGDIDDKGLHQWLLIGARGAYAP